MSLDINTPKGQLTLAQEQELIAKILEGKEGYQVIQTPKSEASDVDGFFCKGDQILMVMENKCRDMSLEQLKNWGNEWLVTYEKIVNGANVCKQLKVPFYGFLYLVPDKVALSIRLADKDGNFLPNIRLARTETQKTVNGGKVVRTNAYISMDGAKPL